MNTKYQIKGLLKHVELDNYQNGCDPESYTTRYVELTFVGNTAEQAIQECAKFLGIEPDAIERNACDEDGRVDFAATETTDTSKPSKAEFKAFERGEIDLYYCVYTGVVERVQTVRI